MTAWRLTPPDPPDAARVSYVLPSDLRFNALDGLSFPAIDIAPDGSALVIAANGRLLLRPLNAFDAVPIRGTDDQALHPVFSPSGDWIAYISARDRVVKRIPVGGGVAEEVFAVGDPGPGALFPWMSWATGEALIVAQADGVWQVSVAEGSTERLYGWPAETRGLLPRVIRGTQAVVYSSNGRVVVQAPEREPVALLEGVNARFLEPGHLIYELDGTLLGVTFD
jgi:hypothetical protein